MVLVGASGDNGGQDPYAVCFHKFQISVGADCAVTVTPDATAAVLKSGDNVDGAKVRAGLG